MEALIGLVARQRGFINHLFGDALAGEGAAQRFLLSLPRRHPLLLIEQVRTAQAEGSLVAGHPLQLMIFIMGSVGLPLVIAGSGRQLGWLPPEAAPFLSPRGCPATPGMGPARPAPHRRRSRMKQRFALLAVLLTLFSGYLWWQGRPEGDPV